MCLLVFGMSPLNQIFNFWGSLFQRATSSRHNMIQMLHDMNFESTNVIQAQNYPKCLVRLIKSANIYQKYIDQPEYMHLHFDVVCCLDSNLYYYRILNIVLLMTQHVYQAYNPDTFIVLKGGNLRIRKDCFLPCMCHLILHRRLNSSINYGKIP